MKIWFRRIFALALISLGISMMFLPFNNTRSGSTDIETVSIEQLKFSNLDEIKVQYPNVDIIDITCPKLNQDDYPNLWDKLIQIANYDIKNEHGDLNEWNNFQINYFGELSALRLIIFREGLIECIVSETEGNEDKVVLFKYLGKYNPYIKELTALDLEDYPMILKIVKNLEVGNELNYEPNTLPKKKWDQMVDRYLDPINDLQTFNFNGNFYAPQFSWEVSYMSGEIVALRSILKIVGLSLFVIGFLLIKKLYYRKKGIMVNPPRVAILFDVITLLFAIPSAYMVVNTILKFFLNIPFVTNEDFIVFIGVFFFCIGIPLITFYTSRFSSQSIMINKDGILIDSLIMKDFISWESLESIFFTNEYILVSRVGMHLPRELQKSLKLVSKTGKALVINEPQLKSVKMKISSEIERNAPEQIKGKLMKIIKNW